MCLCIYISQIDASACMLERHHSSVQQTPRQARTTCGALAEAAAPNPNGNLLGRGPRVLEDADDPPPTAIIRRVSRGAGGEAVECLKVRG